MLNTITDLWVDCPIHDYHHKNRQNSKQCFDIFHLRSRELPSIIRLGTIKPTLHLNLRVPLPDLTQTLPNNLQSVCQVTSTGWFSDITVPSHKKHNHSKKHRTCCNCIAIEENISLLDIYNHCECYEWSNIDKPVEPVKEPCDCLGPSMEYLISSKWRHIRFDAPSTNGNQYEGNNKKSNFAIFTKVFYIAKLVIVIIWNSGKQ